MNTTTLTASAETDIPKSINTPENENTNEKINHEINGKIGVRRIRGGSSGSMDDLFGVGTRGAKNEDDDRDPGGPDKGQGGKFLVLPPGYQGAVPAGYHVAKTNTYGNWVRTIPGKGWNTIFRLYGPLESWFDRSSLPEPGKE